MRIAVLFGGKSGEHEVSLVSARNIMASLGPDRFEVLPVGLAKDGTWLVGGDAWAELSRATSAGLSDAHGDDVPTTQAATPPPTERSSGGSLCTLPLSELAGVDCVFPVLHGPYGEDGTVQGLLELANLPYVGPGVTSSALCMDKIQTKRILESAEIPQAPWHEVERWSYEIDPDSVVADCGDLGWPVFVKPANMGSSVGISKARNPNELRAALDLAAQFDRRMLVEWAVPMAREIEVAVLGNEQPKSSVAGEVVPAGDFYDYQDKYRDGKAELVIPAALEPELAAQIRERSEEVFCTFDLAGCARIDFLLTRGTTSLYLNEINTMPGFTAGSLYPLLWEASGLPCRELCTRLIELALARYSDKARNRISI